MKEKNYNVLKYIISRYGFFLNNGNSRYFEIWKNLGNLFIKLIGGGKEGGEKYEFIKNFV